ncbi:hypothetical protein D3C86_1638160 [compost metagenome]
MMTLFQHLSELRGHEVVLYASAEITHAVDVVAFDLHGFDNSLTEHFVLIVDLDDVVAVFCFELSFHAKHYLLSGW